MQTFFVLFNIFVKVYFDLILISDVFIFRRNIQNQKKSIYSSYLCFQFARTAQNSKLLTYSILWCVFRLINFCMCEKLHKDFRQETRLRRLSLSYLYTVVFHSTVRLTVGNCPTGYSIFWKSEPSHFIPIFITPLFKRGYLVSIRFLWNDVHPYFLIPFFIFMTANQFFHPEN